ncbi:TonB-dependent receptor family protein [Gimibacter soli]|uniref:TonB-dependent receptor n=1 Tax=Gimibacter soli TaxID=3024400 RepID=A0AAE9XVJ2_9PROT|nr:TonB-dependent receptor [Gimibacter soli]WCL55730.1 TonB-dependent receptor [Gimibacter soli]
MSTKTFPVLATLTAICALTVGASADVASEAGSAEDIAFIEPAIERIQVIGRKTERSSIAGSATRLDEEDLQVFRHTDIQRVLRAVPGVSIQEEDGYGLRPNIGMRGTGTDRSAKITLMEDGVLIAPAPYAAPAAYYFPTTARMEAIEVRKGSSAVKFGPRTVGGALNLVSRSIPDDVAGFLDARGGSDSFYALHGAIGGTLDNLGGLIEAYRSNNDGFKTLANGGDTGFEVEDYLAKARITTSEDATVFQSLEIKLSKTKNDSNETYLGLSREDFEADPYQRYAASERDRMETDHEQIALTHVLRVADIELVTTAYQNDFERDWFKFDDLFLNGASVSAAGVLANPASNPLAYAYLRGTADSPAGAIRLQHNARTYGAKGVQSLLALPFTTGAASHDLEVSVRYHEDYESRLQYRESFTMKDGHLSFASAGAPGSSGNRKVAANAWAAMVQDTITFGSLTLVPGVRFETIELSRTDWASNDPGRTGTATTLPAKRIKAAVPGLGISYDLDNGVTLTGGVFKGFNPPAVGEGDVREEESLNIEAGAIVDLGAFHGEAIIYVNDYDNILGTCTASVACNTGDIGDQFNGGKAVIKGLEVAGGYSFVVADGFTVPVSLTYTFTDAEFRTSFSSGFWGSVEKGDALPYVARHQVTVGASVVTEPFTVSLQGNYVNAARTTAGQGAIPADEKVDGRFVLDASAQWRVTEHVELYAIAQNLLDATYAVSVHPIGLRPGAPRTLIGGVKFSF